MHSSAQLLLLLLGLMASVALAVPTHKPSRHPTASPTHKVTTAHPSTMAPTGKPTTGIPTMQPVLVTTSQPSLPTPAPTPIPTEAVTSSPSAVPSAGPTGPTTFAPSGSPTTPTAVSPAPAPAPFAAVSSLPTALLGVFAAAAHNATLSHNAVGVLPAGEYVVEGNFTAGAPGAAMVTMLDVVVVQGESAAKTSLVLQATATPSTSACGQNVALGTATGVLGGMWAVTYELCSGDTCHLFSGELPMCMYYTRLAGSAAVPASINIELHVMNVTTPPPGVPNTTVGCPQAQPLFEGLPLRAMWCVDTQGFSAGCSSVPRAQCTARTNQRAIGIGMSISGIGILLLSLASILTLNRMLSGAGRV
jgi:hypothetical protein